MLGFCSLKISFVLDNTVETMAFVRVNINTDTVPTTCLSCQLLHAYRVKYKMRIVSIIQHAYRASTCSFTVLCKSNESEFRRNLPKLCDISMHLLFPYYWNLMQTCEISHGIFFHRQRNFVQNVVWVSKIAHEISFGKAQFRGTCRLLE